LVECSERVRGKEVRFDVWDTAGQETYRCLVPVYARGAVLALVVFNRSSRLTFESLSSWSEFLRNEVKIDTFLIVGNKSDLEPKVSTEEARNWCNDNDAEYIETSAKTGFQIELLFQIVAKNVLSLVGEDLTADLKKGDSGLILVNSRPDPRRACPC
jgi:small GTP-binding protein